MQRRKRSINFEYLFNLAWQKRFHILVPFICSLMIAIVSVYLLPKIYEAKTLILVEPQRVPGEFVRNIVPQDIRSRIGTISQQILSRSNLEKVIDELQLFSEPQHQKLYMEDKLEALRDRISIKVSKAPGGADAFSIIYRGAVPETVMQVANTLSTLFIEGSLQIREEQAEGTSSFIDEELESMRSKLGRIESELQSYRMRHMGELPEQLESNLKFLETFRVQLEERKERLKSERNRLVIADNEIEQLKFNLDRDRKSGVSAESAGSEGASTGPVKLELLKEEYRNLKSSYTEKHPSVVQMKRKIDDIEKEAHASVNSPVQGDKLDSTARAGAAQSSAERILSERIRQRAMIFSSINGLQEDITRLDRQIQEYQKRIERTPKREEELFSLKRDHDNMQSAYKSLLARKIEADMAVNMEKKKKGEQFQVLDYAKLPEKPVSPNLNKIFVLALAVGIGLGLSLLIALDFADESIRHVNDLDGSGLPILATIPKCRTVKTARRSYMRKLLTFCSISAACMLTIIFAYIVMHG